ncbi:MAG: gephyrin-like molybdotransferase Glp [Fimbriimonadaceae bacterium]
MHFTSCKAVGMVAERAQLLSYEKAKWLVLESARPLGTEVLSLHQLLGRVLASPILARCDQPRFDASAVDGYAFLASDVSEGLKGRTFALVGELQAGSDTCVPMNRGECVRVFTGAPIPAHTGAVMMQEFVRRNGDSVCCLDGAQVGDHLRRQGDEFRAGDVAIAPLTLITPAVVGAIAACGEAEAEVFCLPKVGLLVTGNELGSPGSELKDGQIYESNSFALRSAILGLGLPEPLVRFCPDDHDSIREVLDELLESCDVLISSGGVSVGDYDLVRPVLEELGVKQVFWGVAIKPGKPLYFGKKERCAVFGLPGNPVSALTTFALFVRPHLNHLRGMSPVEFPVQRTLSHALFKKAGRMEFVPARMDDTCVEPMIHRGSHKTSSLLDVNGFVILDGQTTSVELGSIVEVLPLRWGWEA